MSYENAPVTTMLATHCAICGRPLCDAESVTRGIGPDCAKKYAMAMFDLDEATRNAANQLTHRLAILRKQLKSGEDVGAVMSGILQALYSMGLTVLARKAAEGVADVEVTADVPAGMLVVSWSFLGGNTGAKLLQYVKTLKAKYNPTAKAWMVPVERQQDLNGLLVKFFSGKIALGTKGPYLIGG